LRTFAHAEYTPSETSVKQRFTIQMRKYSAAEPVNCGFTTRAGLVCALDVPAPSPGTFVPIRPPWNRLLLVRAA
jgi:hypothetical protein